MSVEMMRVYGGGPGHAFVRWSDKLKNNYPPPQEFCPFFRKKSVIFATHQSLPFILDPYLHTVQFLPFSLPLLWWGLLLAGLLLASALVSGSEAAFFSLTPRDVNRLRKQRSASASAALELLSMQDYLLATILIANNLVNICAIIVANHLIDLVVVFNRAAVLEFVIKTILLTFVLLLFGEIMPKIVATSRPLKFVRFVSSPLLSLKHLFKPLSYLLIRSSSHLNESISRKKDNISMDELSDALEITASQNAEDRKILTGIVKFSNTEVSDVMRPRVDVVALDINASYEEVKRVIVSSGFSRIPVYEEDLDDIKGVLYIKDLIPHLERGDLEWNRLLRKPWFVPDHKKINDLLEEFQTNKVHLAIVVDEYGSTQGVVSLEDILEEIVGEISDESDPEESYYTQVDPDTYIFEGKTHLNDFLEVLGLDTDSLDDTRGQAETLAGYMLEMKREFLKVGDEVKHGPFTLRVLSIEGRRIRKIRAVINREKQ